MGSERCIGDRCMGGGGGGSSSSSNDPCTFVNDPFDRFGSQFV